MLREIKNSILKIDRLFFKIFGSDKSVKFLENIKEAETIFSYLNETGAENKVKFVGGCVRKALCGELIDDIDLATSLKPEEVKEKLFKKNIKVIDTGISHGTLTVILNKKKFEITTLRKDILTDGRHAKVEFTTDWTSDALRRDFTINSIYVDIEGRIFDPLNGIKDLRNGVIKFIGTPEERIQEDYLRILRYFRFCIQYAKTDYDQKTIGIVKQNINGLNKVSNERIFTELKKILLIKNVNNLFLNNYSREIILNIFPQLKYYERLNKLDNLNKKLRNNYDNFLILALLIIDESNNYEFFCYKYKISNNIKKRFSNISKNFENLKSKKFYTEQNIKKKVYLSSKYEVKDLLLFSICMKNKFKLSNTENLMNLIDTYKIPKFPISGEYLKEQGYKAGQTLGNKLKSLEEKWINNNFVLDKEVIKQSLEKINKGD